MIELQDERPAIDDLFDTVLPRPFWEPVRKTAPTRALTYPFRYFADESHRSAYAFTCICEGIDVSKISRFIEYRKAVWVFEGFSLEERTRAAWERLPNNTDRVVQLGNDVCVMGVASADHRGNGFAIHCARYAEQQGVGVLDMTPAPIEICVSDVPGTTKIFSTLIFLL